MPRSELPSERAVIERAIQALRDVPRLARMQQEDMFLGKVEQVLGTAVGASGPVGLEEEDIALYELDDQRLVWYEVGSSNFFEKRTLVLVVPRVLVANLLGLVHCQHDHHPGVANAIITARSLPLARDA